MKYIASFICLFFLFSFSQKNTLELYLSCYKNGDSLSIETLQGIRNISLLENGKPQKDSWFKNWEVIVYNGADNRSFQSYNGSSTIAGPFAEAIQTKGGKFQKIVFQSILISTKIGDKIVERKLPPVTFYIVKKATKVCK